MLETLKKWWAGKPAKVENSDQGIWGDAVVSADSAQVLKLFSDAPTDSGAVVNSATAMRVSAVYACTRLICGAIASLPIDIYKRDKNLRTKQIATHPYWWILNEEACAQWTSSAFWEFMVSQMLLRGDGLAYIVRQSPNSSVITGFLPLRREQVIVMRMPPANPRTPPRLTYFVTTPEGAFGCEQEDMLHFPGFEFNGIQSLSVIQWGARNSIGVAMRADEFAGKFFSQGATPQFALTAPKSMTPDQQERFKAAWADKYQGRGPTGIPLILTEGLDVKELSMSMVDAQLIETRRWQVTDIARAFGVPPHMIGETTNATSFGTGIEQMGQAFIDYTLGPHLERIEDELNRKLFVRNPFYIEFNANGLTRADAAGRSAYYSRAIGGAQNPAWMTPNEIRELENLPPLPEGDTLATTAIPAPPPDQLKQEPGNAEQNA